MTQNKRHGKYGFSTLAYDLNFNEYLPFCTQTLQEAILGNILFSPSGRIDPANFMRGAYILVAIAFLITLMPMVSVTMSSLFSLILLPVTYCWIALFIKRYHDGGQSGWMCMVPGMVYVVGYFIVAQIAPRLFASELYNSMNEAMEEAATAGSFSEIMAATMAITEQYGEPLAQKVALPQSVMLAVLSLLIAFGFNAMIKSDPNENQYGPPT